MRTFLHKLLWKPTNRTLVQVFRYNFLGSAAAIVDIGLLFLLTEVFGMYYLVSAAISFSVGLVINYAVSSVWIFPKSRVRNRYVAFAAYGLIGVAGLALNQTLMRLFTEHLHIFYGFSKLVSNAIISLWNFFARKYLLYRPSPCDCPQAPAQPSNSTSSTD